MLTPEQYQLAKQLQDEANSLATDLQAHTPELLRSGRDAVEFIIDQHKVSRSPGTVAKLEHILASDKALNQRILRLFDVQSDISSDFQNSHYAEQITQVTAEIKKINPKRIDADLLREISRRNYDALAVPAVTATCAASAQVPINFLAFAYGDIMRAYVDKPPLSRRTLDNASTLARAAALDFAGAYVPFLGTVSAIFQVVQPWFEREKRRMVEAIPVVDRLFNLDDGLTGLVRFSATVEESTRQVAEFSSEYQVSFADNIRWLIETAGDAQ